MFGLIHVLTFLFSALLWLLLAAWNTRAAALGMGYGAIGLLNFSSYMVYVASALTLGHLGDRVGFKRPMAAAFLLTAVVLTSGFFWTVPWTLYLTACGVNLFYGYFYPSVEGLLSRMESREGVHPFRTTARFSLSWSSGNILGMVFGPWLIQNVPAAIFGGGILLCIGAAFAIRAHHAKHGERLPACASQARFGGPSPDLDPRSLARLRLGARAALLCGSMAFFGAMFLYPKVLSAAGVPLERVGFITAFGNLAVLMAFAVLLPTRFWIGRPLLSATMTSVLLVLYGLCFLVARTPALFALTVVLGGFAYAVPYTFALFYGLHTPDADHARQGAIHETLIGLSLAVGPLVSGLLLSAGRGPRSLGIMAIVIGALSAALQGFFAPRSPASQDPADGG